MGNLNLNAPIEYRYASLREFAPREHHVNRICYDDVLLLVYEGVLRFSEDGEEREVHPGEYYIQKAGGYQRGDVASDAPKYLFVHFGASETDDENSLRRCGVFDYTRLRSKMQRLDSFEKSGRSLIEKCGVFYAILTELMRNDDECSLAEEMALFISDNYRKALRLEDISNKFNFSKNHIINIFKKEFGLTPFDYLNSVRLREARILLEVSSRSLEDIAYECGFGSYSNFYKRFISAEGLSPAAWRNKVRISPQTHLQTVKNPANRVF